MAVERKVLRSISEFSMFKYLLFFYLIFFILSVIVMAVIGLIAWLGLSSSGIDIEGMLANLGLGDMGISRFFGKGMVITIAISIVGGLLASILYAAFGTLMVWIMNVVLKISGGIELRFLPGKEGKVSIKKS